MRVDFVGWSRNMGYNTIVNEDLREATIYKSNESANCSWKSISVDVHHNMIRMLGGYPVRLGGDYRLEIDISKSEVAHLFRLAFGEELDVVALDKAGLRVDASVIKKALCQMTFEQVFKLMQPEVIEPAKELVDS